MLHLHNTSSSSILQLQLQLQLQAWPDLLLIRDYPTAAAEFEHYMTRTYEESILIAPGELVVFSSGEVGRLISLRPGAEDNISVTLPVSPDFFRIYLIFEDALGQRWERDLRRSSLRRLRDGMDPDHSIVAGGRDWRSVRRRALGRIKTAWS